MPSQPKGYARSKVRVRAAASPGGRPPEAVAADDVVALQDVLDALVAEADPRAVGARVLDGQRLRLEQQRAARFQLEGDQVLAHLGLRVDRHGPAAGEGGEVDAVTLPGEPQLDAVVPHPLPVHARPGPGGAQDVRRALLQDPGALALLDIGPVAALQHDGVDAGVVQQTGEEEAGRAGADDADGGAHRAFPFDVRTVKFYSLLWDVSLRPCSPGVNGRDEERADRRGGQCLEGGATTAGTSEVPRAGLEPARPRRGSEV